MYNRRTWLNKSDSPSLGNVTAFDGEIKYSEGIERTTFLAISDCSKTIKLIKNTENIEDFIDKMKLLKQEIELFINHLENKVMKITDFKKGDLIVRVKQSNEYSASPLFIGDPFIFSDIKCGKVYFIRFNSTKEYKPELFEEDLDKRKDDIWEFYEAPEILHSAIMTRLSESIEEAYSKKDIFKESIFKIALDQFSKK